LDLDGIFKAYDIRGRAPEELNGEVARRIGAAFGVFADAPTIAVGRDCRTTSPEIAAGVSAGINSTGRDVIDLGEVTTDLVYVVSGLEDLPGVMVTASHNPKEWNGIKLTREGAKPVGIESGLADVRRLTEVGVPPASIPGKVTPREVTATYIDHVLSIVDPAAISELDVVVDGGNGMAGVVIPGVFDRIPARLDGLYLEPDGTFPNHHPDPLRPENLEDLLAEMGRTGADLGVAFDGDADRAFFVDDELVPLSGSTTTGIVAAYFLGREPEASIVHNLIVSRAVPEMVREKGGTPVRTRVGHSFIKEVMADTGAIFGGEHSGHYYFRDNFRADSGVVAMLVLLQALSEAGVPLSELRRSFEPYAQSGEINLGVADQQASMERVASAYPDGDADWLDGLTVAWPDRWFNLRPSNTEPVLRLNVEAGDGDTVAEIVAAVSELAGSA
jgi:phosphomannomutase